MGDTAVEVENKVNIGGTLFKCLSNYNPASITYKELSALNNNKTSNTPKI